MSDYIVFKINSFPTFSETFIVSNIKAAIDAGFKVKIIVEHINSKDHTSQPLLLAQYNLLDKVTKFEQPLGKFYRKLKAICLLLNPLLFYYFIKYCLYKEKKTLDLLFVLNFYWKYRNAKAYHVHFATVIDPLFELKEIGFLKSKIVVTFHGHDEHDLPHDLSLKNIICNFNKYVSQITSNTQYLKDKLVTRGFSANKIKIVPIGIDSVFFKNDQYNFAKGKFNVITVGRFVEFKGQSFGINAVKLLIDKGYEIKYHLVGDGPELERVQKEVKDLNLSNKIFFHGCKNQFEIKNLLKTSQLFLMTSTSDTTGRCETFGLVSLEAQAMGLPVVGFKSGGFIETIIEGKTGITVEDKNYIEMANAIELLINDHDKRINMSAAAKKHILNSYTFENTTAQYLNLYQ